MFKNRTDAGNRLGEALETYRDGNPLVLAIPKGGLPVGVAVAEHLDADFSVLVARKFPWPHNPEAGFGAVAEDGSTYMGPGPEVMSEDEKQRIVQEQREECQRRVALLRQGDTLPSLENRTVILVDDGVAMGSTMRASVRCCRNHGVARLVVGVPVASPHARDDIGEEADAIVVLETPAHFRAVAEAYQDWHDIGDDEAVAIMSGWKAAHA